MESYARALLMLLYCLHGGQVRGGQSRPEVFSFATRLTRLTPALAAATPDTMLAKAGEAGGPARGLSEAQRPTQRDCPRWHLGVADDRDDRRGGRDPVSPAL